MAEQAADDGDEPSSRQKQLDALAKLPWCGQAQHLGPVEKEIVAHFDHMVVKMQTIDGVSGVVMHTPQVKYRTKYEKESGCKERVMSMKGLNPSRMGDVLLASDLTPHDVKLRLSKIMRTKAAKAFASAEHDRVMQKAMAGGSATIEEELQKRSKAAKIDRSANAREDERQQILDKYIAIDAAMPQELFDTAMHYLTVFFIMCRVPFSVVTNKYFLKFLESIRPAFSKQMPSQVSCDGQWYC